MICTADNDLYSETRDHRGFSYSKCSVGIKIEQIAATTTKISRLLFLITARFFSDLDSVHNMFNPVAVIYFM
jgi:hypothetical protein